MIVVDTSVWIEYLRHSDEDIVHLMNLLLKKRDVCALSAVFGELVQGTKNKRERQVLQALWDNLPKVNEKDLFIAAGRISNDNKFYAKGIGLIDCYILAATHENDLLLWTLDKKLQDAAKLLEVSFS